VIGPGGVQAVRGERDVEGGTRERNAAARERHPERLQIAAELRDGEVAERGAERSEHRRLLGSRDGVHGPARRSDRERRQPAGRRPARVERTRDGQRPGRAQRRQRGRHLGRRPQRAALDLRRLTARHELAQERVELELDEEGPEPRRVGPLPAEGLEVERDRHVAADGCQRLREAGVLGLARERLADLLGAAEADRLDRVEPLEDLLDRPEPGDERARGLLADAGDAGNVVDRISHEAHDVRHERRVDPEARAHFVGAEAAVAHRVEQRRASVDQLHHVLVPGDDDGLASGGGRLRGERADHVVGLHARDLDHGQAKRVDDPADVAHLRPQLVRQTGPVLLVGRVEVVAKCLTRGIEDDRRVARALFPEQLRKHVSEAESGVGRQSARGAEARERVERAVDVAAAVD